MSQVQNPKQKPLNESDENINQQDINDTHKIIKLAEEEWDQMDTRLANYGENRE
jgi:hypothetical protein